jgi:hypothetical protein
MRVRIDILVRLDTSIHCLTLLPLFTSLDGCHERRFCLMKKEEMLKDGQDEPVTSMPVKGDNLQDLSKKIVDTSDSQYTAEDPVMNAPSC